MQAIPLAQHQQKFKACVTVNANIGSMCDVSSVTCVSAACAPRRPVQRYSALSSSFYGPPEGHPLVLHPLISHQSVPSFAGLINSCIDRCRCLFFHTSLQTPLDASPPFFSLSVTSFHPLAGPLMAATPATRRDRLR